MTVGVVVPAHNEARNLASVLGAITAAAGVDELVVVADACQDATAAIASRYGHVIQIAAGDKGTAMAAGLAALNTSHVLFCDADLDGLQPGHITALTGLPPLDGQLVGVRGDVPLPILAANLPSLSGERRLPVDVARRAGLAGAGWEAETRLNALVARLRLPWRQVVLRGVSNPTKAARSPMGWAGEMIDVAAAGLTYGPELIRYTVRPNG